MTRIQSSGKAQKIWVTQLPIDYINTTLTINTWETVSADLSGGVPARLWGVMLEQTNNGAAAEDIELEITFTPPSGTATAYTFTRSCDSGTIYFGGMDDALTGGDFSPTLIGDERTFGWLESSYHSVPFTCKSVGLIRVRQTSAVDVVAAQIEVNVIWDKLTTV